MEGKQMSQLKKYYVVRRTNQKDEEFAVIHALSLEEANVIFKVRYSADKETMKEGEAFLIFEAHEVLSFDNNSRGVFPSGEKVIIHKLS